jgi:hypothetical protein
MGYYKNVKRNKTRPHVDRRGKTGSMVQNDERKEKELMEKLQSWSRLR